MPESIDPLVEVNREVMARVAAAVEVVTLIDDEGALHGMTISSLAPVSAEPPSLLVCIGPEASTRPSLVPGQAFCINVLASDQVDQSVGFAYGTEDPFEVFEWSPGPDGTPILGGTTAHLMCEVERVVVHHETAVVMAKVIGGATHKDEALVYWMQSYYGDLVSTTPVVQGTW
jgi:flavin reductase (DIM6/NTAB) family NADH-FMN oxidoreductase RutF